MVDNKETAGQIAIRKLREQRKVREISKFICTNRLNAIESGESDLFPKGTRRMLASLNFTKEEVQAIVTELFSLP